MPDDPPRNVTMLLAAWGRGEQTALEELLPLVYAELHRQAEHYMRGQPDGHTLQTTALVHEAYLRLVEREAGAPEFRDRAHFFAVASKAMRSVLVDHARSRRAAKRGGAARRVSLGGIDEVAVEGGDPEVLALDDALARLADLDPRQAQVVELRYFAGLSIEEVAEMLGVSHATVERDWRTAKLWLKRELATEASGDA